jgi:peptidoglycan hydrolase CwlO-like protein
LERKNETLIEENSKLSRRMLRLIGIEEKFLAINTEKKEYHNKELVRENKAKCLEIESLNNSLNFLKSNIQKMQEKLTSEKTNTNKMVLETTTLSNQLKNRGREVSGLEV